MSISIDCYRSLREAKYRTNHLCTIFMLALMDERIEALVRCNQGRHNEGRTNSVVALILHFIFSPCAANLQLLFKIKNNIIDGYKRSTYLVGFRLAGTGGGTLADPVVMFITTGTTNTRTASILGGIVFHGVYSTQRRSLENFKGNDFGRL